MRVSKHYKKVVNDLPKQGLKVSVYQATHNQICKKSRDYLVPIQVGAALTSERYAAVRDNIGENISEKNPYYCELTALYWAWKNDKTSDIIGLCHYRRKFLFRNAKEIEHCLKKNDVIVPRAYGFRKSLLEEYKESHCEKDLKEVMQVLVKLYPEYRKAAEQVFHQNCLIPYNMMIMRREQFDAYCEWLFSILFCLERKYPVKEERTAYQNRYFGFLAERLENIYLLHNHLRLHQVRLRYDQKFYAEKIQLATIKNSMIFMVKKKCRR